MKAAVLHEAKTPLVIEDLEMDACGPNEVRIQVAASGLCHSDYHFISGDMPFIVPGMAMVPGHEVAGIVIEVGDGVRGVRRDDHVVTCLSSYCGHCRQCAIGLSYRCVARPVRAAGERPRLSLRGKPVRQMGGLGGFAEEVLVHESAVAIMPKEMPLDRAAVLGCAVVTGVGAAINTAKVRPGDTVVVVGCGGVGLNVIQGAVLCGAQTVIAVDQVPTKLELARRFGATHAFAGDALTVEAVKALTRGGVDHAFEAVGLQVTQQLAFSMLGVGGLLTLIGVPRVGASLSLPGLLPALLTEQRVQGSIMGSSVFQQDLPRFARMYLDGRLKLDELVSQRIALDDINAGFAAMLGGAVARTVVVFDEVLRASRRPA
ncbi:MAG TPA: Zn-dependent alcohol dehydrogenase [Burkholderiaceae bacterium]|jgi:S-(hydroxymethyl)glutathione dehydrogenase/alcohol dehydrogenase